MVDRLVIVGNGGAAISTAIAIRSSGFPGEIVMFSDVDSPAFNPMLAPYYLKGMIAWERCFPFGPAIYRDLDVTCRFGDPVATLDAAKHELTTSGGAVLSYDRCLVASGASADIPPVPGLRDCRSVFVLRTAASTGRLEGVIAPGRRALVLGASFVGLKVAEILRKRHVGVIVLDVVDQVLPRGAHPLVAALLKGYMEEKGIDIRLGCAMNGMEGARGGVTCHFSDGVFQEVDFVVACTGVRPNIGFLNAGQVNMDQAILVSDHMCSSLPDLYAAGDVCQGRSLTSGRMERFGTWKSAWLQGRIAGLNMAGVESAYGGSIQENISPFFDWLYAQIGDVSAGIEGRTYKVFEDRARTALAVLAFEDGAIVGANLLNCTELAGEIRRAITQRDRFRSDRSQFGWSFARRTEFGEK